MKIIIASLAFCGVLVGQLPNINTQTQGTLNINRGGCGATTPSACLANLGGVDLTGVATLSNKTLTSPKINSILDTTNGSTVVQILPATGATEGLSFTPSVAGSPVVLATFGSGANVDLTIDPKGVGIVRLPAVDEVSFTDGSTGQFIRKAANGRLEWATVTGLGTVTSVGLSGITSFISITGSPITSSGTFTMGLNSQPPNTVFGGPTSGSGTPTFRALVANDIPNLDASKVTTGVFAADRVVSGGVVNSRCLHIDGTGAITVASADCNTGGGGNITSINSQVGPAITITQGTTGSDFTVGTAANVITINCPSASGTVRGCLTSSDWTTFSNKVGGSSLSSGQLIVGNTGSAVTTGNLSGVVTTAGSTVTTFTNGSTGSGAVVLQNSPLMRNPVFLNANNGILYGYNATSDASTNFISLGSIGTGFHPTLAADGVDTNINLVLRGKGTGVVDLGAVGAVKITGGASGQVLQTNGSGVLSWASPSGGPTIYCSSLVANGTADDQAAITSCLNSLPLTGGTVDLPCGDIGIGSTLDIANGTITAAATRYGITLRGCGRGSDSHVTSDSNGQRGATRFKWVGAALSTKTISGATNATPVQLNVTGHGFTDHQMYVLVDQAGRSGTCNNDSGANGVYQIRIVDSNTLELRGSTGNGTYNGTCPGTLYYGSSVLRIAGPTLNIRVEGIHIDGGATNSGGLTGTLSTGVPTAFVGLEVRHASNSSLKDISITRTAGLGVLMRTSNIAPIAYGNCHGYVMGLDYLLPQHQRSSGMAMTGYDAASGMDTCSWKINDVKMAYGGGSGSFGVEEAFADNNNFLHLQLPKSTGGTGVDWRATRQVTQTAFPQAQVCDRCYIASYSGQNGTGGGGKYLWLPNYGSQEIGGVIPATLTGSSFVRGYNDLGEMWGMKSLGGFTAENGFTASYTGTDENYPSVVINNSSGGQNGAGRIFMQRAGTNIASIKAHYFDGIGLYVHDGGGTGTLREVFRGRVNGLFTPMSVSFSDLGGEPTGSYGYCSNCQVTSPSDNTCTSGGSGALAWKINSVWRCFAAQN